MNDSTGNTPTQAQHLETLKRQAKQRFIGAAILLLIAVIAIPFVLGSPPRVVSSDIVIDIPKIDAEPVKAPAPQPAAPAAVVEPPVTTAPNTSTTVTPIPAPIAATRPAAPLVFAPAAVPNKQDDGNKAAALLSGTDSKTIKSKYVVQAGSYTDEAKLQAASHKLTQAGIQHYTQAATAKDGTPRTRLRLVGPFDSREEANSAAAKVSKLGIASIVLKP